ncbi:hypothetical protein BKA63DRAFT_587617 [Paraphoma chrysanthemicola]|nr:hypothetical protein BKA63DRAFT_587617 [Paraphoma chrysanthemicola]
MQDSPSLERRSNRLAARDRLPVPSPSRLLPRTPMDQTWTRGQGIAFRHGDASTNDSILVDLSASHMNPKPPSPPPTTTAPQSSIVASSIRIFRQIVFILSCIKCSFSALQQYQNSSLSTVELVTKYASGIKGPDSLHSFLANPYTLTALVLLGEVFMNEWSYIVGRFHAVTGFSPRSVAMGRYWTIILWAMAALLVQIVINMLMREDCLKSGDIDKRIREAMQKPVESNKATSLGSMV